MFHSVLISINDFSCIPELIVYIPFRKGQGFAEKAHWISSMPFIHTALCIVGLTLFML